MAEEEVIILEDDYVEEESSSQTKQESKAPAQESEQVVEATVQDSTKVQQINLFSKRNIIIISVIFFFIILTFIILIFSGDSKQEEYFSPEEVAQDLKSKEARETFEPSKLDNLLKKANLLYNRGNRQDALKIYEDIAHFNEGLSNYNIGVARMNEEEYAEALESFKLAIRNSENRTISAINAAVCALELKNSEMAEYYLDLAYAY